jgi:hypothetical protein
MVSLVGERRGDRTGELPVVAPFHQVDRLPKRFTLVGEQALRIERERCAVEDQLVLRADPMHIKQRQLRFLHPAPHHLVALGELGAMEGRRVDRQEHLRARRFRLGCRFGEPQVLADGEPHAPPLDFDDAGLVSRLEITLLVEDLVVGQALLEVHGFDASAAQHRGGVVARAALAVGMSDDDREVEAIGRELHELRGALVEEIVAQEQVFGG